VPVPSIAQKLRDARSENLSRKQVRWMAALIFVGTALPEEILFRGVLLTGWKAAGYSVLTAVLMSCSLRALAHLLPNWSGFARIVTRTGAATSGILGAVGFTTLVGNPRLAAGSHRLDLGGSRRSCDCEYFRTPSCTPCKSASQACRLMRTSM
jgi:hypothetical protein